MQKTTKKFLKGFSLIEASISLIIMGIISGICITQLASFTAIDKMQKTQKHCEIVINALGAYYIASDGTLPFPIDNKENGFGRVPFKKLGIMEKFAKDGYGNFLLYKVNPFFNKETNDLNSINLGITEFAGINDDKVAIILKAIDKKGNEIYKIWYSERNFKVMFPRQTPTQENKQQTAAGYQQDTGSIDRDILNIPDLEDQ